MKTSPWLLSVLIMLHTSLPVQAGQAPPLIESLEQFQRMERQDFLKQHSWVPPLLRWLIPPVQDEIPPQYQTAFSLYLRFDHSKQQVAAEYHFQKMMDPSSYTKAHKIFGKSIYRSLVNMLEDQNLICQTQVISSWSGPAPTYLRLKWPDQTRLIYAGDENGPEGPSEEFSEENLREYLCTDQLLKQLAALQKELKP